MAVSGDSAAIKQMLNNMSSEELLKYYDGDSSISASLFDDRTFPFWAFLVLAAFILLFALLRLHAATLTFSILNLLLCALYAGILIFILVSASHEMDVVRSTASQPGLNLANDLSFSLVPSYGMYAIIAGTLFMFVGAIVSVVNRSHARRAAFASPAPTNPAGGTPNTMRPCHCRRNTNPHNPQTPLTSTPNQRSSFMPPDADWRNGATRRTMVPLRAALEYHGAYSNAAREVGDHGILSALRCPI